MIGGYRTFEEIRSAMVTERERLGLTAAEMADYAGLCDKSHWLKIATGRTKNPSAKTMQKIVDGLAVAARPAKPSESSADVDVAID